VTYAVAARIVAALALVPTLVGCAVLTIEVDVYKGPLANEPDVQVNQMVAMASATQALLVELRNDEASRNKRFMDAHETRWSELRREFFWDGDIASEAGSNVALVNQILRLFGDATAGPDPAAIPRHLDTVYAARERMRSQVVRWNRLIDVDAPSETSQETVEQPMIQNPEAPRASDSVATTADVLAPEITRSAAALRSAYGRILAYADNERPAIHDLIAAHNQEVRDLFETSKQLRARTNSGAMRAEGVNGGAGSLVQLFELIESAHGAGEMPAQVDAAYAYLLEHPDVVDLHAMLMFGDAKDGAAEEFRRWVAEYAEAFGAQRRAIDQIFVILLEIIRDAREIAAQAERPGEIERNLKSSAARAASYMIKGEKLEDAVERSGDDADGLLQTVNPQWKNDIETSAWRRVRESIAGVLRSEHGAVFASMLLRLHREELLRSPAGLTLTGSTIARQLSSAGDATSQVREFVDAISDLLRTYQRLTGLSSARLPKGINTLTNEFVSRRDAAILTRDDPRDDLAAEAARQALTEALVRFAQKVVSLADHRAIEYPDRHDQVDTMLQLQTLGNAILTQANELNARDVARARARDGRDRERSAIASIYTSDPVQILDDLAMDILAAPKAIDDDRDSLERVSKAKEALDAANTSLSESRAALANARAALAARTSERDAAESERADWSWLAELFSDPFPPAGRFDGTDPRAQLLELWRPAYTVDPPDPTAFRLTVLDSLAARAMQTDNPEVRRRLKLVMDTLTPLGVAAGADSGALFVAMHRAVRSEADARRVALLDAQVRYETALAAVDAHTNAITRAQDAVDSAESGVMDARTRVPRVQRAKDTIAEIKRQRSGVIAALGSAERGVRPSVEHAELVRRVAMAHTKSIDGTPEKTKLAGVLAQLRAHAPGPSPAAPSIGSSDTAIESMDSLIAFYRHRLIAEIAEHGRGSEVVARTEQALEQALEQRATMVYVRPSSMYLRNSLPATGLQDNRVAWENMLGKQAMRSLPFAAEVDNAHNRRKIHALSEIDKQYWQNINRVRVAGGGDTNYAVVKGPLGNWSVKAYSSDSSDIINSAKNLALFNLGVGINPSSGDTPARPTAPDAGPSLERLLTKYDHEYAAETRSHLEDAAMLLAESAGGVAQRLRAVWEADASVDAPAFEGALTSAGAALSEARAFVARAMASASAEDDAEAVIVAMRAMRRYHDRLRGEILAVPPSGAGVDASADEAFIASRLHAQRLASRFVAGEMRMMHEDRMRTIDRYSRALRFMSEATAER